MRIVDNGERFMPQNDCREMEIEHMQRYCLASKYATDKIVLDVACGEGYGSEILSKYAKRVIGIDIDKRVVQDATDKYKRENLSYICSGVDQLPFDNDYFDLVISYETIEHIDAITQEKFLKEIKRVLRADGILIMSTPNKKIYTDLVNGYNKYHIKEFYLDEYEAFLKQEFRYIDWMCQFLDTGYFIANAEIDVAVNYHTRDIELARYFIAICSNKKFDINNKIDNILQFDNSMYYFLNSQVHVLEKQYIDDKKERDSFIQKKEEEISIQKEYIAHLENDIKQLKQYIAHLENDIKQLKQYVAHIEK